MKERNDKCPKCGGILKIKDYNYIYDGISFGMYKAEICTKNKKHIYFDSSIMPKLEKKAKELYLWNKKRKN